MALVKTHQLTDGQPEMASISIGVGTNEADEYIIQIRFHDDNDKAKLICQAQLLEEE